MPAVCYYLGRPASVYTAIMSRRPLAGDNGGRVRRGIAGSEATGSGDAELVAFGVAHDDAPAAGVGHPPRFGGADGR
jgi:hypothetical protein